MKKLILAVASLALVSAPLAASAAPFGHGGGWHAGRGYDRGHGAGGVVAAGLFGLIAGAAIADSYHQDYAPRYDYAPQCGWTTERYVNAWGHVEYHQVQVCR